MLAMDDGDGSGGKATICGEGNRGRKLEMRYNGGRREKRERECETVVAMVGGDLKSGF